MKLPKTMTDEKTPFQSMTLDTSQNQLQWRSYIFGPYYRLAQLAFPSVDSEKKSASKNRISTIIGFIALAVGGIPLLYRTVFMLMQLSTTTLFSLNWAFNLIFVMLSFHSVFSLITLFMLAKNDFYNDFTRRSLIAIKNKVPSRNPFISAHVILGIFMIFFIYAYIFYIYENTVDYELFVTEVSNSSANYRTSMFGGSNNTFFWFDAIILVWAGFVSALALVIYNLVSNNLVSDYSKFNEELKEASKAGQLAHADLLNNYGTRQLELLDLARFAYAQFSILVTFTFVAGFITHALGGFIMRSFVEEIPGILKILAVSFILLGNSVWSVTESFYLFISFILGTSVLILLYGLFLLLADVKRTSDFAHQLTETSNILLFERSIYSQMDANLSQISNNIIFRIAHTHYLPKAFSSFKINEKFFQRAFLIFPFLIEFLHANRKYIS